MSNNSEPGRFLLLIFIICLLPVDRNAVARQSYPAGIGQFGKMIMIDGLPVQFRLGNGTRFLGNPVIRPEAHWEDLAVYMYGTVLYDSSDSLYKMWYKAISQKGPSTKICYATSPDGYRWSKPIIGTSYFDGSNQNNIVFIADASTTPRLYYESFSVIQETSSENNRFTAFFTYGPGIADEWSKTSFFFRAVSNDGKVWEMDPNDALNHVTDEVMSVVPRRSGDSLMVLTRARDGSRTPMISKSASGLLWTEPKVIISNEDLRVPESVSYWTCLSVFDSNLVGLMGVYRYELGEIYPTLIFSTDAGENWVIPDPRISALRHPDHLAFDSKMIFAPNNPFMKVGDEIWMYYSSFSTLHGEPFVAGSGAISLVRWDASRFLGVGIEDHVSEMFVLKKIVDSPISMDFQVGLDGAIDVGLVDEEGDFIPGFGLNDFDTIRFGEKRELSWKGQSVITEFANQYIGFVFRMKNATLFDMSGVEEASSERYRAAIIPIKNSELSVNYPNPFNSETIITYKIEATSRVRAEILNVLGQRIEILEDNVMGAGQHQFYWKPVNKASGVYFCQLEVSEINGGRVKRLTGKLLYLK